ncbi:hypothetical protein LCGC14_2362940, partial [marine sediment metagenome]
MDLHSGHGSIQTLKLEGLLNLTTRNLNIS